MCESIVKPTPNCANTRCNERGTAGWARKVSIIIYKHCVYKYFQTPLRTSPHGCCCYGTFCVVVLLYGMRELPARRSRSLRSSAPILFHIVEWSARAIHSANHVRIQAVHPSNGIFEYFCSHSIRATTLTTGAQAGLHGALCCIYSEHTRKMRHDSRSLYTPD